MMAGMMAAVMLLLVAVTAMAQTTWFVSPGQSIQAAIDGAASGDTIQLVAGTYVENIVVNKRLNIIGVGDSATGTVIQGNPLLTTAKVVVVTVGGTSSVERLVIEGIRITGGRAAGPGGNDGAGIELATGVGHVLLSNVTSIDNDGHGFDFNATAAVSDVHLENCAFVGNKGTGVRIPQSIPSLIDFSLTGSTIADNEGIGVLVYSEGATGITIADCIFERNNPNGATGGDLVLSGFTGDAVLENLSFASQDADSVIRMSGPANGDKTPKGPAGIVVFRNILITGTQAGTYPGAAIAISRYTDGSQISFEDVVLASSGTFGMHLGTVGGTLNLAGVTFNGTYSTEDLYLGKHGQQDGSPNSYPAAGVVVDASAAIFAGLLDPFAIEDSIYHALDDSTLGLVVWNPNNVYVTPSSGSIQRGVDVAGAGWTVNVAEGIYVENVDINGSLALLGQDGAILDGTGLGKTGINVDSGHVTLDNLEVRNYSDGILVYTGSDFLTDWTGVVLTNNTIHPTTGGGGGASGFGLYVGTESERFWTPIAPWGMAGLDHLLDFAGLEISGNEIYDTSLCALVLQSITSSGGPIQVIGNNVHDSDSDALWIDSSSNILVQGNSFVDSGTGIFISAYSDGWYEGIANQPFDTRDVQILYNVITGNTPYGGIAVYDAYPATIDVHYNVITGNSIGVNNWVGGGNINAPLNWWGSSAGPSGEGIGAGDSVSTNVIFSPWLGSFPDGDPTLPGVQITGPITIIVAPAGPEPAKGYLNTAIVGSNELPFSDVIEVRHGTYDASEPITEGVTMVSEVGSATYSILNGDMSLDSAHILIGRLRQGFTINGNITVGAGINASDIHINWNDILGMVSNNGTGTLDATFNYWGEDGPDTMGAVAIYPLLPISSDTIIGYMDEHGLSALDAINFAVLLDLYLSEHEALVALDLMDTFGFSEQDATDILDEYGALAVNRALAFCSDYEDFLALLMGYASGGGGGGSYLGGGAGGTDGMPIFVAGSLIPLQLQLVHPVTGEPITDAVVSYSVCRTLDDGTAEIVMLGVMKFDGDLGAYVFEVDTSGLEPGIYDIFLGTDDGRSRHFQIEVSEL